jgi:hypothetical protein
MLSWSASRVRVSRAHRGLPFCHPAREHPHPIPCHEITNTGSTAHRTRRTVCLTCTASPAARRGRGIALPACLVVLHVPHGRSVGFSTKRPGCRRGACHAPPPPSPFPLCCRRGDHLVQHDAVRREVGEAGADVPGAPCGAAGGPDLPGTRQPAGSLPAAGHGAAGPESHVLAAAGKRLILPAAAASASWLLCVCARERHAIAPTHTPPPLHPHHPPSTPTPPCTIIAFRLRWRRPLPACPGSPPPPLHTHPLSSPLFCVAARPSYCPIFSVLAQTKPAM